MAAGEGLCADRPFPGLRPFGYADRAYFFGREEQIYALYNLLDLSQFVAVVGSSGSGKSSLVRAGLLPLLERESEEVLAHDDSVGRAWRWIELRPGDTPLSRLTEQLARLAVGDAADPVTQAAQRERIDAALRRASFGMTEALSGIDALVDRSLLILVDQFEELFRYGGHGTAGARLQEERDQFVQLLLEATSGLQVDVHVLITMRSDFIGDCAQFYGLPEAVSACQFLVPSLTREQREEVIRRPLEPGLADSAIEPALVERLLNDAGSELDQLPVLQHCLSRLWEAAGPSRATLPRRQLRLDQYAQIGGIANALSRHADLILAGLAGHEIAVEQVFRALSEVDREGRATRRALSYADLRAETGVEDAELRQVIDRFRDDDCSFIVPPISSVPELGDRDTVDIGHEALLRRWKKIGAEASDSLIGEAETGWLDAEAGDARFYRAMLALGTAHTLPLEIIDEKWAWWRERPRTAAWAHRYGGHIERIEQLFANSLAEQVRQRRGRHALRGFIAALVAIIIGGGGYYYWRINEQARTVRQERAALVNEMTEITQRLSTQLRFIPGTNGAILRVLDQINQFSDNYSKWLSEHDVGGVTPADQWIEARLKYTAQILKADYQVNFGRIGNAIAYLNTAQAELAKVPGSDSVQPLQLLAADIIFHRAKAEMLYGDGKTAATLSDYGDAEKRYTQLADLREAESDAPSGTVGLPGLDYPQIAKERLTELYQSRMFFDLQFRRDPDAAAKDFAAYNANAPATARQTPSVRRAQADLWAAQGGANLDKAIRQYEDLLNGGRQVSAVVLPEADQAYTKYRLALALTKRAQGGDIAEAIGHLQRADKVFSRYMDSDQQNSWWPLVCGWMERALGQAYNAEHDYKNAAAAFREALAKDRTLAMMDPDNPRPRADAAANETAATLAERGE